MFKIFDSLFAVNLFLILDLIILEHQRWNRKIHCPLSLTKKNVHLERLKNLQMTDFSAKHPQDHQISIHIFAWRRERSLKRLLDSLIKATYNDYHHVPLFLHIDGDPMAEVVEAAHAFAWPHGPKVVEVREERVGMPKVCTFIVSSYFHQGHCFGMESTVAR